MRRKNLNRSVNYHYRLLIIWCLLTVGWFSPAPAHAKSEAIQGITISCPRWGAIWDSEAMDSSLVKVKEIGANWVAIHPYARINTTGEVIFDESLFEKNGHFDRAAQRIKNSGLKYFVKPHLAYWGSFAWRGDIDFANEKQKSLFFENYQTFILAVAGHAQRVNAPLLSIGIEYKKLSNDKRWLRIIKAVRKVYSGKLTYSANWDEFESVPFWHELDLIGIQAYFPLAENAENVPTSTQIRASWSDIESRLRAISKRNQNKKVLFTEIGYDRTTMAALEPWKTRDTLPNAEALLLRKRLIEEALHFESTNRDLLAGLFFWKWMPGQALDQPTKFIDATVNDGDFSMREPEASNAVKAWWRNIPQPRQ